MIYFISTRQQFRGCPNEVISLSSTGYLENWAATQSYFAFDLETTGLDPHQDKILLAQIGNENFQFIVDMQCYGSVRFLAKILEGPQLKIGVNLTFDYKMLLSNYGIHMENIWDCSRVDEVLYNGLFDELHNNPEQQKRLYYKSFSMASMAKRYLDKDISKEERKTFINHSFTKEFSIEQIRYAAKDVIYPIGIRAKQEVLVDKYKLRECVNLENEVALVVGDMEFNGISLNKFEWLKLAKETEAQLQQATFELDSILLRQDVGFKYMLKYKQGVLALFDDGQVEPETRLTTVDWESPDQTLKVLKDCGYNIEDTTKRSLIKYAKTSQLISALFKYRELAKACSTYGTAFIKNIHPITGRIHTKFEQLYPSTGRVSSSNPNLQNIKRGSSYRDCFIAAYGFDLLTADYSNQELRLIADASGDPLWLKAFRDGVDLHGLLAQETFNISKDDIKGLFPGSPTPVTYREVQKMIDFMLAYGGGAHKLADAIGISIQRAQEIIDKFFSIVPYVEKYLKASGNFGRMYGYCRTFNPINRIRWFKKFSSLDKVSRQEADIILGQIERQSKNTPIQGTGADIVKMAMVNIRRFIRDHDLWDSVKLVLQVHDELVVEVRKEITLEIKKQIERIMVTTGGLFVKNVSMSISINHSDRWLK